MKILMIILVVVFGVVVVSVLGMLQCFLGGLCRIFFLLQEEICLGTGDASLTYETASVALGLEVCLWLHARGKILWVP